MKLQTAIALWVSLFLHPAIWADTLLLESGSKLEGRIVDETKSSVVFALNSGSEITLPTSDIQNLIRSDTSEISLQKGDAYLEKKEYEKAFEAYRKARDEGSTVARQRLEDLDQTLMVEVDHLIEGYSLDESEKRLRDRLEKSSEESPYRTHYHSRLSQVLSQKGKRSLSNRSPEIARGHFAEAWALDPTNGSFGQEYLEVLERTKVRQEVLIQFLTDYILNHPDATPMVEELALRTWKKEPCETADLLVSAGDPSESTNSRLRQTLPEIFKKCFDSDPFPESTALSRTEYYEIFMELRPDSDQSPLFEAKIAADPEESTLFRAYSAYLIENNRSAEAAKVYERLLAIDPGSQEAKDFLEKWEAERESIALQEAILGIEKLERPYRLVATLTQEDFPLIKDPNKIESLLKLAREVSSVLDRSPVVEDSESAKEDLNSLRLYRQELESVTRTAEINHLLNQTKKASAKPSIEDKAPDFSLSDLDGNPISLSDFSGRVVLLYFWATWCPACRQEIPFIATTHEMFKEQELEIVGISLDTDRSDLIQFLQANPKISWPHAFDGKGWETPAALIYGVDSTPSSYLIDKDGIIRFISPRGQKLFDGILQLLSEDPGGPRVQLEIHGALTK